MRYLTLIIACLIMLLTSWSGVAHAAACMGCPAMSAIQQVEQGRTACNDEQVPKNMGKGCVHCQAGCHSQTVSAPVVFEVPTLALPEGRVFDAPRRVTLLAHIEDPALRPPQA